MSTPAGSSGLRRRLCAIAISASCAGAFAAEPADRAALDAVVAATCDKSVVLLGEATHGDGHADAAKAALVQRLVSECGFGGVLFEASVYEFTPIARNARAYKRVAPRQVADAVSTPWKFDDEVQPLFEFLAAQATLGKIELGGLDFQAGTFQQPYGNEVMITELAARLPTKRRWFCTQVFRARTSVDDAPDGLAEPVRNEALASCLREIGARHGGASIAPTERAIRASQLANLQAWVAAGGRSPTELARARDRMMAANAIAFIDALPAPAKVVVWSQNGHAARSPVDAGADSLGAALSRRYGNALFALATTACGGDYRWAPGTHKRLSAPPADSLEARACRAHPDVSTFVDSTALRRAGTTASGVLGHAWVRANWAEAFDGVLVLDRERAPRRDPLTAPIGGLVRETDGDDASAVDELRSDRTLLASFPSRLDP